MKYRHFSIEERELIQELLWQKVSVRGIAKRLGRSHSSVIRELRNSSAGRSYQYRPRLAHERALRQRKSRGRKDRLKNETIRIYVTTHIKLRWSPEQISGRLKKDLGLSISHEAIYQYIYAQIHRDGWGLLRRGAEDLRPYLRRKRKRRMGKNMTRGQRVFKFKGASIETRPQIVNQRKRVGDWEGDTVESCDHKPGLNTLVERKTGYTFITKLKDKTSNATIKAVTQRMNVLPQKIKYTLTLDNGPENSDWKEMQEKTKLRVYSAHPYCSGERGTNENTNGLIRDYFPKKTDFTKISDELIKQVEYDLNTRPRKRLNWSTPLEAMSGALRG
jgi:transposase, IS30 family